MSQNEARIKLSVDTSQAQRDVNNLHRQLNELGSGTSVNVQQAMGTGSGDGGSSASDAINSQRKLVNSIEDYLSGVEKSNERMISALNSIEQYLRGGAGGGSGTGTGGGGKVPSSKSSGGSGDFIGTLSKTLFSMQAISSAISATLGYLKSGAAAGQSNEMAAYKAYGTLGLYNNYTNARNETAQLGLPLGYNASESIAVTKGIINGTGGGTKDEIQADATALLRAARGLNVDESTLTTTATDFYKTGTYGRGQMNQFTNLLGTLVEESGMVGREDETLEVLNAIHLSLKENLTNITESQYESTLGLYSLMSEYNSNYQGAKGSNMIEGLNSYIAGDNSALNVALGWGTDYQGWGGYWQLAQQKEQGLGNPNNLKSILETFNAYSSNEVGSEEYMGQLYKYLNSSFGADTEFTKFIADNMDTILSGSYSSDFRKSLAEAAGTEYIDDKVSSYEDTSLSTKNQFDAEKSNAAEQTSSSLENAFGWFQDFYNSLPTGAQSVLSIVGGIGESVLPTLGGIGLYKGGKSLFGKLSGAGATATEGFASYTDEIVDAINGGGNVDDLLTKFSKNGKVTDEMYDWVDEVVDAYNSGSGIDDALNSGYKQFGKAFSKNTGSGNWFTNLFKKGASSVDEVASATGGLGGLDDAATAVSGVAKGASWIGKASKLLGIIGIGAEVVSTGIDVGTALKSGDDREAASELAGGMGSIAGGTGGAYGGAAAGAAIGAWFGGVGAIPGAIIGGILGGIGGGMAGNKLGEVAGEGIYDATSDSPVFTEAQKAQIQEYYNNAKKLYEEDGNNAAQDYTLDTIVPYLQSIGVSKSIVDKYKSDTGRPDFMKDVEGEIFGDLSLSHVSSSGTTPSGGGRKVEENTSATDVNTEAVEANTEALHQFYASAGLKPSAPYSQEYLDSMKQGVGTNNISSLYSWKFGLSGSHATGNDYIPYDGYIAELHKGEAVLDKNNADDYRSRKSNNGSHANVLEIRLSGSVDGMTQENQSQITRAVVAQIQQYMNNASVMNQLANGIVRVAN